MTVPPDQPDHPGRPPGDDDADDRPPGGGPPDSAAPPEAGESDEAGRTVPDGDDTIARLREQLDTSDILGADTGDLDGLPDAAPGEPTIADADYDPPPLPPDTDPPGTTRVSGHGATHADEPPATVSDPGRPSGPGTHLPGTHHDSAASTKDGIRRIPINRYTPGEAPSDPGPPGGSDAGRTEPGTRRVAPSDPGTPSAPDTDSARLEPVEWMPGDATVSLPGLPEFPAESGENTLRRAKHSDPTLLDYAGGEAAPPDHPTPPSPPVPPTRGKGISSRHRPGGEDFGRYLEPTLLSDSGGMGSVWVANDPHLDREVVIKVIKPQLLSRAPDAARVVVERFLAEAQIGAQLEHPNILPVHEFGRFLDGRVYFTMKYIRGVTLSVHLRHVRKDETERSSASRFPLTGRMPEGASNRSMKVAGEEFVPRVPSSNRLRRDLLEKFLRVCDAVAFAHSRGVIHRDIKPQNVMIGEFGEVMLADWGLARILERRVAGNSRSEEATRTLVREAVEAERRKAGKRKRPARPSSRLDATTSDRASRISGDPSSRPTVRLEIDRLREEFGLGTPPPSTSAGTQQPDGDESSGPQRTRAGSMLGTLGYMAPEQVRGENVDHRSDIYALGCILYELVTLSPAYPGRDQLGLIGANARGEVEPAAARVANPFALGDLEHILAKCLAVDPGERYQTVGELIDDVEAVREFRSTSYTTWWRYLRNQMWRYRHILSTASLMLLLLVGVLAALLTRKGTLSFDSNPSGATVRIGDEVLGTTPLAGVQLGPGGYTVRIEKPGYYAATEQIQVSPAGSLRVTENLRATTGRLDVATDPPGATLVLLDAVGDELARETSPHTFPALPAGAYALRWQLDGYRSGGEPLVQVNDGNETTTLDVALESLRGRANVDSTPAGAEVLVWSEQTGREVRGTTPFSSDLLPAGPWQVRLSLSGYRDPEPDRVVQVPEGNRSVYQYVNLLQTTGLLNVSANVLGVGLQAMPLDVTGEIEPFSFTTPLRDRELPSGEYRLELTGPGYTIAGGQGPDRFGRTVVVPEGRAALNVTIELQRVLGSLRLTGDDSMQGATLRLTREDGRTLPAITLPSPPVDFPPGLYMAEVVRDGYYPLRTPVSLDSDTVRQLHISLEPVIKARWQRAGPQRSAGPVRRSILPATGDLDGDGAPELLVLEDDSLLVWSPLRGEPVWQPVTLKQDVAHVPVVRCGDVDGDGDDDLVLGVDDQVQFFEAPSGRLMFVRDARGRASVRGVWVVDGPPAGAAPASADAPDLPDDAAAEADDDGIARGDVYGGQPLVLIATRHSLTCHWGRTTPAAWTVALPEPRGDSELKLHVFDSASAGWAVAITDSSQGTLFFNEYGDMMGFTPGIAVWTVANGRVVYSRQGGISVTDIASFLRGDYYAPPVVVSGSVVAACECAGRQVIAMTGTDRDAIGGRVVVGLDPPQVFELDAAPVQLVPVQQGHRTGVVVVLCADGSRHLFDARNPARLAVVGMGEEPGSEGSTGRGLTGLTGTGQPADVDGDGSDELVWCTLTGMTVVDLDRAGLRVALDRLPEEVWRVDAPLPMWVLRFPDAIVRMTATGAVVSLAPAEPDDTLVIRDGWLERASQIGEQIVPATAAGQLEPMRPGERRAGVYNQWWLTRRSLLAVAGPDGLPIPVGRRLGWPGNHSQVWHHPAGVVATDTDGVTRLLVPPPREACRGAHMLAACNDMIDDMQAGRTAAVHIRPMLADMLDALPRSADALWCAGTVWAPALPRDDDLAPAELTRLRRAQWFWRQAIRVNPGQVRARFSLADSLARRDEWDDVRELLEPVLTARYRYARTLWYLLDEAARSGDRARVARLFELFRSADPSTDPEFAELRDPETNPRYTELMLWIFRFLR